MRRTLRKWSYVCTRGVQKVRRPTQLTTRYATHIIFCHLSFCHIVTCNWNALGPAFLQRSDTIVEEMLFLVFQPDICLAIRTRMANTVGEGVVQSRNFGWQPVLELTCDQMRWQRGRHLHGIWLAGRPRTTILLQRDQSSWEMLDQAHFSCRCLCWKVTKYDGRIS